MPLLFCGEELVCVVGVAVAAAYQAGSGESGLTAGLTAP
ncbi:MAG: TilS substrate C-terminal domain-containing protein [Gallionellaceae bacterium]|nr:TilS substrate C-terminal domain-containing protein [Gallionellaceae bacterium]